MKGRGTGRGVALIAALVLMALAGGLVAVIGLTSRQLIQTDRLEAERVVLRQMLDSGAAWALTHAGDWPTTDGKPDPVRLDPGPIVPRPHRGLIALQPEPVQGARIERVRVEARLIRHDSHEISRSAILRLGRASSVEHGYD